MPLGTRTAHKIYRNQDIVRRVRKVRLEGPIIIVLGCESIVLICAVTEFRVHSGEHLIRARRDPRVLQAIRVTELVTLVKHAALRRQRGRRRRR